MARKGGVKERLLQIHDLGDHTGQGPPGNKKEQGGGGDARPTQMAVGMEVGYNFRFVI